MTRLGKRVARLPTPLRQVTVEALLLAGLVVLIFSAIAEAIRECYAVGRPAVYRQIREYRAAARVPGTGQETTDA